MNELINIFHEIFDKEEIYISNNSIINLLYGNTKTIELETNQRLLYIFLKINKHNFFRNIKIKGNTILCDNYIIKIIPLNKNIHNILIKNMKYDIKNRYFINKCSKICIEDYDDLLINPLQCIEIFDLMCYDIEIENELLLFIETNSDLMCDKLHAKENYNAKAIPLKLYQIQNIKKFIELIKINTFLHKMLFNINFDENLYNIINPLEIYELYAIVIIQHFKYNKKIFYEKIEEKKELDFLLDSKKQTLMFNKVLEMYEFKKCDYEDLKEINYLFYILNLQNVSIGLKVGYILKNYYSFSVKNIYFCFGFYNFINKDKISIFDIIEDTKYYVLIELQNIPEYKKNKKININNFQNSFIYFYKYLFEAEYKKNKKIDFLDYDKIMKKSIKKIKQLLYYEFDIITADYT
jgi:hypothetical protein